MNPATDHGDTREPKPPLRGGPAVKAKSLGSRSPRLLPPICYGDTASCSGHKLSIYQPPKKEKNGSRFHTECAQKKSIYLDWSSVKIDKKSTGTGNFPNRSKTRSMNSFKDAEELEVVNYLERNKDFLDTYVYEKVPADVLEKWLQKKRGNNNNGASTFHKLTLSGRKTVEVGKRTILTNLLRALQEDPNEHSVLWELANYVTNSVGVDAYRVYKLSDNPGYMRYFVVEIKPSGEVVKKLALANADQVHMVMEVAKSESCRRLSRCNDAAVFPKTPLALFQSLGKDVKQANHVMYQPILSKNGKTTYVIEMWRIKERFRDVEEEISSNFLVLGSLALHYCTLYLDKKRERNMTDFLLDVVKAIFEEMVSLDHLIKRILEFAQRLVNADRASLFLVDYKNLELVSTVFDLKVEGNNNGNGGKKEIRMPINRGIAGHVALSGETMNISDAYSDPRFNRAVDEATGYKTVSILCMPVKVEGKVIGVVQMVNKRDDVSFVHEDEIHFEMFASFFGLALHHARLYDRIMRKEQKYRVALEVLSYHNTCKDHEVSEIMSDVQPVNADLDDYYLNPFDFDEFQKCKCVIRMFSDLFELDCFDISTLTRFVLTVKKNYRAVPYHNFDHGWTVAHAMYVMLKNDRQKRFDYNMRLALFVASLCHDLDHRGYTNQYMSEIASPLAAMYSTSTLEHHHFNITVTILQQDGHNIFSHISGDDYKVILGYIRHCILATDLAVFFPNLARIKNLHGEGGQRSDYVQFDWAVQSHTELAMAISMTAADLSASAKPWDVQIQTVKVIFDEFYDQGDKERAAGKEPMAMMDRHKPDEQPSCQVGFLSQICIACYSMLYQILPDTKPMYDMALRNLEIWKSRAVKIERKKAENAKTDEVGEARAVAEPKRKFSKIKRRKAPSHVVEVLHNPVAWDDDVDEIAELLLSDRPRSGIWKKDITGKKWVDDDSNSNGALFKPLPPIIVEEEEEEE